MAGRRAPRAPAHDACAARSRGTRSSSVRAHRRGRSRWRSRSRAARTARGSPLDGSPRPRIGDQPTTLRVVLDVVDQRPVDVGQLAERQRAHGEPVVVEGARQLGREGQRHVEHLAAHEARRAGDDVGLQLGAEVVPRRHAIGPVGRRDDRAGRIDDPHVAEGERGAGRQRGRERRELGRMPDVVLVAGGDELRRGADPRVAALEGAPGAAARLVVLAHERPLGVALLVQRGELARQARGVGPVDGEADGDHARRIADFPPRRRRR